MKKNALFILLIFIAIGNKLYSQDLIVLNSGEQIKSIVLEVGLTEIKYKKFDNRSGPVYVISKADVSYVIYENGSKDIINKSYNNENPDKSANTNNPKEQFKSPVISGNIAPNQCINPFKDRFGIYIGGGGGFQNINAVTLANGSNATISFGGGTVVNIEYGHEFNKYFELAVNFGGQFSELSQTISNGSVEFDRSVFSFTPSLILPLTARDNIRLKLGAGLDYIFGGVLNINLNQVTNGGNADVSYNSIIGEHVSVMFETISRFQRLSFDFGIIWLNTGNFSYQSTSNSNFIAGPDLINPNGSGIDFVVGICYRFK